MPRRMEVFEDGRVRVIVRYGVYVINPNLDADTFAYTPGPEVTVREFGPREGAAQTKPATRPADNR